MLIPQGMTMADYCDPPEMTECEICGTEYPAMVTDFWTPCPLNGYAEVPGTCPEECENLTPLQQELEKACRRVEAR